MKIERSQNELEQSRSRFSNVFSMCLKSGDDCCIFDLCPLFEKCFPEEMDNSEKKIVVTAGGFDPLHCGHVRHILEASSLGDYLIVIVNRDVDMIRKKGYCFMPLDQRMEIIKSIKGVSEVFGCIDEDGTITKSLEYIKPNILAKGGDRRPDNMPVSEIDMCKKIDCKIVYGVGGNKIQSSSQLVKRI